MPLNHRACCCGPGGPGGPPPGGYCPDGTIRTRSWINGNAVPDEPFTPNYVPAYFTLTLPSTLDLSLVYPAFVVGSGDNDLASDCGHPFLPGGIVSLCPGFPNPVVLTNNCQGIVQTFTSASSVAPTLTTVQTRYVIKDATCDYSPRLYWRYQFSDQGCGWGVSHGTYVGWARPGRILTIVQIEIPVVSATGKQWSLWASRVAGVAFQDWPTPTADEDASGAARIARENQFFLGQFAQPALAFGSPFRWMGLRPGTEGAPTCACGATRFPWNPTWSDNDHDPFAFCGRDDACTGDRPPPLDLPFSATAGTQLLEPTTGEFGTLYVHNAIIDDCPAAGGCDSCQVLPVQNFGSAPLNQNVLPDAVVVELPGQIGIGYRGAGCGNWSSIAPMPWTRQAPAQVVHRLPIDPNAAPFCGNAVTSQPLGTTFTSPWVPYLNPTSTNWATSGVLVVGSYFPDPLCVGQSHLSAVQLSVGFVVTSPLSVPQQDRMATLLTMCRIDLNVEKPDGTLFAGGSTFFAVNFGPQFRVGDYASPFVQDEDKIRLFAMLDNPWSWTHDFNFNGFYLGYLPTVASSCDGYSMQPDVYTHSVARTVSGVEALEDYCGQAAAFQYCARGENHSYAMRASVVFGGSTLVDPLNNNRYCSSGAACLPPPSCGESGLVLNAGGSGTQLVAEIATLDAAELAARRAESMARGDARQARNQTICDACPSGLWNPAGYCQYIFNTCRCSSPVKRAAEKTIAAQRVNNCPKGHFPQESTR